MQNKELAKDYIQRSEIRLEAIEVLLKRKSWADVVRECQEVTELTLKALLRSCGIEPPRLHDVSGILSSHSERLPSELKSKLPWMIQLSKHLRRDRELAFYGSEDLTPSAFYSEDDATSVFKDSKELVRLIKPFIV